MEPDAPLSTCCIFNVLTVSNIEARATTLLYEAWFEQKLFGNLASIRVGQLGAAIKFFISHEMAFELTYQAPIIPAWIIQPDFQYVFHPRYGAIDPINPSVGRIPDAAVFGLRTVVKF